MTELTTPAPSTGPIVDYAALAVREAARDRLDAELRPANKAALLGALRAAAITSVVVTFDGCGDSGQIEEVEATGPEGAAALPAVAIEIATATWAAEIERRELPVGEAIEELCYDLLNGHHAGWEDNDGAFGEITFDVAADTITLDYNGRYTALDSHTHEF